MNSVIVPTTDAAARTILAADGQPVLVDFSAGWCAPCNALAPLLENLARERTGSLKVVKLDIDEFPKLAQEVGVRSVPTLLMVRDGAVLAAHAGLLRKDELAAFVDGALA